MNNPSLRAFISFAFFLLCTFSYLPVSLQQNLTLEFSSFTLQDLTLLGDSYLRNGLLGLTREVGVPTSSSGSVICNYPIRFLNPQTNSSASFTTRFTFSITNANPYSFGNGMTFFLSSSNQTLGNPGGCLGLFSSLNPSNEKIVAVEFDTRSDDELEDPNSNHVGLDIGSCKSIKTSDVGSQGVDLKSGNLITTWVEYDNSGSKIKVWLSYSNVKPEKPLLSLKVDLSKYFEEFMYVGFSASKEGSTELHTIMNWRFQTFQFGSLDPPHGSLPQPQNVSDRPWSGIPVSPVLPALNSTRKSHKKLVLGLEIAGPFVLFTILLTLGWYSAMKGKEIGRQSGITPEILTAPRRFNFKEIKSATRGFHSSQIVACGPFGTMYKAFSPKSALTFVVKRSKYSHQGRNELVAELTTISCLRHKNLLLLQGWCIEKDELLLLYEFMPNGSLDNALHQDGGTLLTWRQRYTIAAGVASALTYLHQECEQQVLHRDISTSNILLDGNFNPKLGDFALARFVDPDKSPLSTLTTGTIDYVAPDYLQHARATEKTDVYSYGVLILEVASGRKPIDEPVKNEKTFSLINWVWELYSEDKLLEAVDPKLNGDFEKEEVRRLLLLGLSCANPDCRARPSMRRVLQILRHEAEVPDFLKKNPSFASSSNLSVTLEKTVSESGDTFFSSPLYEIKINCGKP